MGSTSKQGSTISVVIIGKDEGPRLTAGLQSIGANVPVVYVDSGSSDGSVDAARALGAEIVELDLSKPFTAARARNAGLDKLRQLGPPEFVQFIDGDCTLAPGWLEAAEAYLCEHCDVGVVCGRRREKFPEATIYNRLTDREWDTPIGETDACGGDALMRWAALDTVGGYDPALIAGEEPELCLRLRTAGWKIYRLDVEMTGHDIAMTSLGQWLKRARRAGHAFAEVSTMHRDKPERIWHRETLRALLWSGFGAAIIISGLIIHPIFLLGLGLYPLQVMRMALREKPVTREGVIHSFLILLQKPWEAAGIIQYWMGGSRLIEYKKQAESGDA